MKPQGNVEDYDQSIIKTLREKKKWSRRELAEKSGITQQTILNVEQNRFPASLSTITALIQALDIDFSKYVSLSHRFKSAMLEVNDIKLDSEIDHSIKFYEYNGYYIGIISVGQPVDDICLARLPYFNVFTYAIDGSFNVNIDGEDYSVMPNECISLSGLSKRVTTVKDHCKVITILKNKCNFHHNHNPLEDLATILETYPKHLDSEKEISICKDDMDFSFIKFLRNTKNMSLDTLAEAAGLSTSAISLIENNKRAPSLATISALSTVLNETTVNLFTMAQKIPTTVNKSEYKGSTLVTETNHNLHFHLLKCDQHNKELFSDPNHPFCLELHVPLEGKMTVSIEDGEFEIQPGDVLAFDGMRNHSYKFEKGYTGIAIDLPKENIMIEHKVQKFGGYTEL